MKIYKVYSKESDNNTFIMRASVENIADCIDQNIAEAFSQGYIKNDMQASRLVKKLVNYLNNKRRLHAENYSIYIVKRRSDIDVPLHDYFTVNSDYKYFMFDKFESHTKYKRTYIVGLKGYFYYDIKRIKGMAIQKAIEDGIDENSDYFWDNTNLVVDDDTFNIYDSRLRKILFKRFIDNNVLNCGCYRIVRVNYNANLREIGSFENISDEEVKGE